MLKAAKRKKKAAYFNIEKLIIDGALYRGEIKKIRKIVSSHDSSHSRGVLILFKPRLDADVEKITALQIIWQMYLSETVTGTKMVLVNIYVTNDATQQVVFLRGVSKEFLIPYTNDNLVLGGDFNCTISTLDKKGSGLIDSKKASLNRLQSLVKTHN